MHVLGFYFSATEKSALEQAEGGPCAIIAPIQAFILKNLLLEYEGVTFRDFVSKATVVDVHGIVKRSVFLQITDETQNQILIVALCEILQQCNQQKYYIVHLSSEFSSSSSNASVINGDGGEENTRQCNVDSVLFHENLRRTVFPHIKDVEKYYFDNIQSLRSQYGILLFLYSVIATRVRT